MREAKYINGTLEASGRCIKIAIDSGALDRKELGITGPINTEERYPIPFEAITFRQKRKPKGYDL